MKPSSTDFGGSHTPTSAPSAPLPPGWQRVRLGEVCRVVSGSTPDSGNPHYWNGDIVWITPTDLGKLAEPVINDSLRRISRVGFESCGTELVPAGSVVLSSRAPIGHIGIASIPLCTNQGCKSFVPSDKIDSWFLYFALKHDVQGIQMLGSGATFAEVSKSVLQGFQIPLPPLAEQRRIAAKLREQMAAVERAREAVHEQRHASSGLYASHLRHVFEGDEARAWPNCRLGDILLQRREIVHPHDNPSGSAVFVGLEHIESTTGRRIGSLPVEMSELTGRKPRFARGDIVYGYLRPYLNKVWIAEFDGLCSVDQFAFEVRGDEYDAKYIAWFMRSPTYLRRSAIETTTGQLPRIGIEEIAAVEIPFPSQSRRRTIVERFSKYFSTLEAMQSSIGSAATAIERLPAALLREAFSGRSPEATRQGEL